MIFVTLGSQKFQFDRLLKKIDELIQNGELKDKVFAQIGYCDYVPQNYEYKKFLNREEFGMSMEKSSIVITHGVHDGGDCRGSKKEEKSNCCAETFKIRGTC